MFLFNAVGLLSGVAFTGLLWYSAYYAGDFKNGCLSVHGRVCNGGACNPDGVSARTRRGLTLRARRAPACPR